VEHQGFSMLTALVLVLSAIAGIALYYSVHLLL
jgi:hypothetical protein